MLLQMFILDIVLFNINFSIEFATDYNYLWSQVVTKPKQLLNEQFWRIHLFTH